MKTKIFNGMNLFKKNLYTVFYSFFVFLLPFISFADNKNCDPSDGKICNPLSGKGIETLNDLIKVLLQGIIKIGFPIVALAIIYSGFLFVFARGNPEKLSKAKDTLLYTIIGAAILLGSWAIAKLIASTVLSL